MFMKLSSFGILSFMHSELANKKFRKRPAGRDVLRGSPRQVKNDKNNSFIEIYISYFKELQLEFLNFFLLI